MAPVTMGLVITLVVCFLANWSTVATQPLFAAFSLRTSGVLAAPWAFLTYPFAVSGGEILGIAFGCLWLWMIGTQVERDMGAVPYLAAFFGFALLGALFVTFGAAAMNVPFLLAGTAIPVGAITMIWGARNKSQIICFFGIVPLPAPILCVITAVFTFLSMGFGVPLIGLCSVLPLALAWFWADNKLPVAFATGSAMDAGVRKARAEKKREQAQFNEYIGNVREREIDRKEREKLRELFERSLITDPEDDTKEG